MRDLTAQLVKINSRSGSEGQCAEILAEFFEDNGVRPELQEISPGRWNVLASVEGDRPLLLLNGHLDIVETVGDWSTTDPFVLEERKGMWIGSGVCNMKAQVAAMALATVRAAHVSGRHSAVLFSGVVGECDELGLGTRTFLERGGSADFAIVGEPTGLCAQVAHGGTYQAEITFRGRPMHISRLEEGVNAVEAAARFVLSLRSEEPVPRGSGLYKSLPRALAGRMVGGYYPQITAPTATVSCDIRLPLEITLEQIEASVSDLAERASEAVGAGFDQETTAFEPAYGMSADGKLYVDLLAASFAHHTGDQLNIGIPAPHAMFYATDAAHLEAGGIPSVVFGPGVWTVGADESISAEQTATFLEVLFQFVTRAPGAQLRTGE